MARMEEHREDLLREATALAERLELGLPDQADTIVIGFRRDGSPSFYFGSELVLQFNTLGELRRGYDRGLLFKAVDGRLISLKRERDGQQVVLQSHPLSAHETSEFSERAFRLLEKLHMALRQKTACVGRQIPENAGVANRIEQWLATHGNPLVIASRPNVG